MNARYRKQMRLKSRHVRRGHPSSARNPWGCRCPEFWTGHRQIEPHPQGRRILRETVERRMRKILEEMKHR